MLTINKPVKLGVRVVMHVSPSVYVAGLLTAQRREMRLSEFLNHAIASACASDADDPAHTLPWSPDTVELFLQLADTMPDAFRGPWKVLYAKVLEDESLWLPSEATVGDAAEGQSDDGWRIDGTALAKAWPRLVSSVFRC